MKPESPEAELARLLREQWRARQDEAFGGFSESERAEFDKRAKRIKELEAQLLTISSAEEAAAERRRMWNGKAETDMPQREGRQPYRSRERDSTNAFINTLKAGRTKQEHNPEGRD